MIPYLHDPQAIYKRSFEIIDAEADYSAIPLSARSIARRMIHACGMTDLVSDVVISPDFVAKATQALADGRPILVDSEMVKHGMIARFLPSATQIICTLNDPNARIIGMERGITRSAAAVELWLPHLDEALVVIGNAPTALFALLELIDAGHAKPACIIAMPVGFVGAAESKDELVTNSRGIAYVTVKGRRGGSAIASSVINALTDTA